jgi:hypothetical protein
LYSVLLSFLERNRIFFAEIHHRCLSLTTAAATVEVGVVLGALGVLFDFEFVPAPPRLALGEVFERIISLDSFVVVIHVQSATETARAEN